MNILSLFDGVSCGRIALERAAIQIDKYFASEIDTPAINIAKANYPDTIYLGDVNMINGVNLPPITLLMGGSPCQGFSFAGKGLNFKDPRSKLFFQFNRLLKEVKPKYFLLENTKMNKDSMDIISNTLGIEPIEINSALVSGQNRVRNYWTNIPGVTQPENKDISIHDIIEGDFKIYTKKKPGNPKRNQEKSGCLTGTAHAAGNHSDMDVLVFNNAQIPIMDTSHRINIHVSSEVRRYSVNECETLQTMPPGYTQINGTSPSQSYKALINGWTIDVITHILKNIPLLT